MQKKKMRINRLIMIGLVATSLLASCKKENTSGNNASKDDFVAIIEQTDGANNGGRSHINPENWDNNTNWSVLWTANDLITIRNAEGTILNYQLTQGENTTRGTFYTGELHEGFLESSNYSAIYPAFNEADVANTISGTATLHDRKNGVARRHPKERQHNRFEQGPRNHQHGNQVQEMEQPGRVHIFDQPFGGDTNQFPERRRGTIH